jgi:hypothetical protein
MQILNTNQKFDFDNHFANRRKEVERINDEIVGIPFLPEKEAEDISTQFSKNAVEQTVKEVRMAESHNRESIQMQLDESKKRKQRLEEDYSNLKNQKAKHLATAEDHSFPWIYMAIYGILLIAMFSAAAWTAALLFGEQGRLLAWITSFVFIGGSALLNNLYWGKPEEERTRLFNHLNWIGLLFFLGLTLSFALGRAVLLIELHQATANTGGFSLTAQSKGDTLEIWQYGSTISAFIFMVLLELCFGSTTLISIHKRRKPRIDVAALEANIRQIEDDIKAETLKASGLAAQLKEIDNFDDYQKAWAERTRSALRADFLLKMAKAKEEAIRRLLNRERAEIAWAEAVLSQPNFKNNGGKSHEPNQGISNNNGKGGKHDLANLLPF